MEQSLFIDWIKQYFPALVLRKVETLNDENMLPTYLFKKYLKKKFSVDGKWTSLSVNNQLVRAEIIALDSSIPLKSRASLGKATGDIPKIAMEFQIREQELTELNTLMAIGQQSQAIEKFFADTPMVIGGQMEAIEQMFLELLSSGVCELTDAEVVGTGVRLDAGYLAKNKFDSDLPWSNTSATPITDLQQLIDEATADQKRIQTFLMDRATYNKLKASEEGKSLYAVAIGNFGTTLPTPNEIQFNQAFKDSLGADIQIVERSIRTQRDGVNTTVTPWKAGSVIGITTNDLGSYVWAALAERTSPVAGVSYETADEFILVSKFRLNRPSLMEVTNSQSRVAPVIDNVEAIYLLDSTITTV